MKINGWDISEIDAKQWRVDQDEVEMENSSEWIRGAPLPVLLNSQVGFKNFTITLLVYGYNRINIQKKIGKIIAALLEPAELELDGYEHKFVGTLGKPKITEHSDHARKRFQILELPFAGYECADLMECGTFQKNTFTVVNPGQVTSPLVLELTPVSEQTQVTINGICRDSVSGVDLPVTVRDLHAGKKILLDGVTGLITEDGELKAPDVDIWALPTLLPGINTIVMDNANVIVMVKILPLFLY